MTDQLLFSHLFAIAFVGLAAGSIIFFLIKTLSKSVKAAGIISIALAFIVSITYFFITASDILRYHSQTFIDAAITVNFYHRLDLAIFWIIGTSTFWISTNKYQKAKKNARSK